MFRGIMDTLAMLSLTQKDPQAFVDYSPYKIWNRTEIPIQFRTLDGKGASEGKWQDVGPNEQAKFQFSTDETRYHYIELKFVPDSKGQYDHVQSWESFSFPASKVAKTRKTFTWNHASESIGILDTVASRRPQQQTSNVLACERCDVAFSTFTVKRRTCKFCGNAFCKECSNHRFRGKRCCEICFNKAFAGGSVRVYVICECTMEKGMKLISVHSPVGFTNYTDCPLEWYIPPFSFKHSPLLSEEAKTASEIPNPTLSDKLEAPPKDTDIYKLNPKETAWMPLLDAAMGLSSNQSELQANLRVRFRPDANYGWSNTIELQHPPTALPSCMIRKMSQKPSAGRNGRSISVYHSGHGKRRLGEHSKKESKTEGSKKEATTGKLQTIFKICSPIVVENLLAADIGVSLLEFERGLSIKQRNGELVGEGIIKKGEEYMVPFGSFFCQTHLQLWIPELNCDRSSYTAITNSDAKDLVVAESICPEKATILLKDQADRELLIELECKYEAGVLHVTLFSPFWLFDLTDLGLIFNQVKGPAPPQWKESKQENKRRALMFNFSKSKKLVCQEAEGKFKSSPFSISANVPGSVNLAGKSHPLAYELGVDIKQAPAPFQRTKIVCFAPRFILKNQLKYNVVIQQRGVHNHCSLPDEPPSPPLVYLERGQTMTFHPYRIPGTNEVSHALSFRRVPDASSSPEFHRWLSEWNWSGFFDIQQFGDVHLSIRSRQGDIWFCQVSIRMNGGTLYLILTEHSIPEKMAAEHANVHQGLRYLLPFRVENRSSVHTLRYRQSLEKQRTPEFGAAPADHDEETARHSPQWTVLPPHKAAAYAWEEPLQSRKLDLQIDQRGVQQPPALGELSFSYYYDSNREELHVVVVGAKGLTEHSASKQPGDFSIKKKIQAGFEGVEKMWTKADAARDSFVVVQVLPDPQNREYRETDVIYNDLNPTWNEAFTFRVSKSSIFFKHLKFIIKDKKVVGSGTIGLVEVSLFAPPIERLPATPFRIMPEHFDPFVFEKEFDEIDLSQPTPNLGIYKTELSRNGRRMRHKSYLFIESEGPTKVLVLSDVPHPDASHSTFPDLGSTLAYIGNSFSITHPIEKVWVSLKLGLRAELLPPNSHAYCVLKFHPNHRFRPKRFPHRKHVLKHAQTNPAEVNENGVVAWKQLFSGQVKGQRHFAEYDLYLYVKQNSKDCLLGKCQLRLPLHSAFEGTESKKTLRSLEITKRGNKKNRVARIWYEFELEPSSTQSDTAHPEEQREQHPKEYLTVIEDSLDSKHGAFNDLSEHAYPDDCAPPFDDLTDQKKAKIETEQPETRLMECNVFLKNIYRVTDLLKRHVSTAEWDTGRLMCRITCQASQFQCAMIIAEGGTLLEPIQMSMDSFRLHIAKEHIEKQEAELDVEFYFMSNVHAQNSDEKKDPVASPSSSTHCLHSRSEPRLGDTRYALECRSVTTGNTYRLGYFRVPLHLVPTTKRAGEEPESDEAKSVQEERKKWSSGRMRPIYSAHSKEWNYDWNETNETGAVAEISVAIYRALPLNAQPIYKVSLRLPKIGLSLIDGHPEELMYISLLETNIDFEEAEAQRTIELKLGRLQADDTRPQAVFPIVLAPTAVKVNEIQPCVQISVNMMKDERIPVFMFRYASLLIQKLDVQVAEDWIYMILAYINELIFDFTSTEIHAKTDADELIIMEPAKVTKMPKAIAEEKPMYLFFDLLQLQPIACNLSFQAASVRGESPFDSSSTAGFVKGVLTTVLTTIGAIAGSLDSVPLRLHGKQFHNASGTIDAVLKPIIMHYVSQGAKEAYKIIGSFEFLGNPVGLAGNIGDGAKEFFYEPVNGLVAGPTAFTKGLAKGSLSLVNNTVKGVFGAASKITGSVSKGVAILSMDDQYIASRSRARGQPQHAGQALRMGGEGLISGITKGVTGIVKEPIKGMREEGAKGLAKGLGKGLVGVVAKPTVGVVDLASTTLAGIGNTVEFLTGSRIENKPLRPRRKIEEGHVEVYNLIKAEPNANHRRNVKNFMNTITRTLKSKRDPLPLPDQTKKKKQKAQKENSDKSQKLLQKLQKS